MQAPLHFAVDNRLPEILDRLQELFPVKRKAEATNPLDQLLYAVVGTGLPASSALAVYRRLRSTFPKLSCLRDASGQALKDVLVGVPAAEMKAAAIPEILRQIEEAFGALTLDPLARLDTEAAHRFLSDLPRVTDAIAASVLSFSGHERIALHVEKDSGRVLRRLGLSEPGAPLSALPRQLIERAPMEWRSATFLELSRGLLRLADRFCHQGKPDCASCPLASLCPSARETSAQVLSFPLRAKA